MTRDEMLAALKQAQGFIGNRAKMAGVGGGAMLLLSWWKALKLTIAEMERQTPMALSREALCVMSREPVWLETKNGKVYNGFVLVYEVQYGMGISGVTDERLGVADPSGRMHWLKLCDYGVTWRCWTDEPTEGQKEGTPWN